MFKFNFVHKCTVANQIFFFLVGSLSEGLGWRRHEGSGVFLGLCAIYESP